MPEVIGIGDRVRVYFDPHKWQLAGWHEGRVIRIDPYSGHRSFYWVELDPPAQTVLKIKQISVFNPRNIQKIE